MSPRGLPYIGAGDWNDGLSACGLKERGESIWLGQFLVGLLADWHEILTRVQGSGFRVQDCESIAAEFVKRRTDLIAAINEHGWDGEWYWRATLDDGSIIGSRHNRVGRIFLNAQTWAILNDVAPPDRAKKCWDAVKAQLVSSAGALLLAPAFDVPDERIGYITRYAPGLRENGGVYTHAATWAIAAACKMRDHETLARLLTAINPAVKDPETYWAEPYVLPGNVDGPQSPYFGRAGWTWYTGSAQWLHRIVSQWVFGVRPELDGLRIDPCLPNGWDSARMVRLWRGVPYQISMERKSAAPANGSIEVRVNGERLTGTLIPPLNHAAETSQVRVSLNG
jgi:cellobiose phosphorylase